jgi:hypothetical protein
MGKILKGNFLSKGKKKGSAATKQSPGTVYQLHVLLLYCEPLIWRRILVPANMKLSGLHTVLQVCMGWSDSHLHQFRVGNAFYGPAALNDDWSPVNSLDEQRFALANLEDDMRYRFFYDYDFGDGWQHEIRIEKVFLPDEKPLKYPVLLAGERACPPEDIGGPPGYDNFLAAMSDPKSEDYEGMRKWYGSDSFNPDAFERAEINKILKK